MNNLVQIILNRITTRTKKKKFDILVLKGFSNETLLSLSAHYPALLGELPIINEKIDLEKILGSFRALIRSVDSATDESPKLLDFESFIHLAKNITLDELEKRFLVLENNLLSEYPNQSNAKAEDFEFLIEQNREIPEDNHFHRFYANAIYYNDSILVQYIDGITDESNCVELLELVIPASINNPVFIANDVIPSDAILFQPFSHEYIESKINLLYNKIDPEIKLVIDDNSYKQITAKTELELLIGFLEQAGSNVKLFITDNRIKSDYRLELVELLQKHWNSSQFRMLDVYEDPDLNNNIISISQAAVVEQVITQFENGRNGRQIKDIFLTAPTGAGKSLLFQMPAIYLAEHFQAVTIVISPLIALMKDQVISLRNERNYLNVAYINSELSLIERDEVIQKVQQGITHILYLSPELLLSYDISMFIGERKLGLLVVDEAHLVTTWGRDFRVDYWYLGNFIRKIRKYHDEYKFPVMAVTATAVYNGPNDMAFETLNSLSLENAIMYIGKVTRDDIQFNINTITAANSTDENKIALTISRIKEFILADKKAIIYCPWTRQLAPIRDGLGAEYRNLAGIYHGGMDQHEKAENYTNFKNGTIKAMVSTKAFGMGIDIDDIEVVYHHAPSGHLADYIQEIGRAARKPDLHGTAMIDFHKKDLKYTKILYGLSSIKPYQIKLVMEKILKAYDLKKKRNLLVSVDDFLHIFDTDKVDVEQKVKSCLLLLENDLLSKYRYNVIIARPKGLFTTVFCGIKTQQNEQFLVKFGQYASYYPHTDMENRGRIIYKLELNKLWEDKFSNESFPMTKKRYFDKKLFVQTDLDVTPQIRIIYNLNSDYPTTMSKLTEYFQLLEQTFASFAGNAFSKKELEIKLREHLQDRLLAKRISDLVLSIYASEVRLNGRQQEFVKPECFIQQRRVGTEYQYRLFDRSYPKVKASMRQRFQQWFSQIKEGNLQQIIFIPVNNDINVGLIKMAYILETFNLGTYEISGGEKSSIFIRINDPIKLRNLFQKGYSNMILKEIDRRQKTSIAIMEYFFSTVLNDTQRWAFIEDYFLGKDTETLMGKTSKFITEEDEEDELANTAIETDEV